MLTALKASLVFVLIVLTGLSQAQAADPSPLAACARAPQDSQATETPQDEQATGTPQTPSGLPEETPEDELAPAALRLELSTAPPIIQKLYAATRETKDKNILARLSEAKELLDGGANLQATDPQGRTALHWTVFGSSYGPKDKVLVAYEDLADALISRGVAINRQDVYQNTALDYLIYSPTFELQTLLLESGANSGFLAAVYQSSDQCNTAMPGRPQTAPSRSSRLNRPELFPGATLSVRLDVPVYSDRSRTGDPIQGTVTYPLCKNGEEIECAPGQLLVPPGTKIGGTVLFAQKAPDKYSRPRLVLDFSNIVHSNKEMTPLYARVLNVDNARETVQNNEILGIVQPHASSKFSLALSAIVSANPLAGYTIKGVQTVYGLSIRREILFPAGTDLQLQVVRPSVLKQQEPWTGWRELPSDPKLQQLVTSIPLRTTTPNKTPSDLTNLVFLGAEQDLIAAFGQAGWMEADNLNVRTALKAVQATMRHSGYSDAPVSLLLLDGRPPDIVLQKSLNTFAKRHHIRIWKMSQPYNGRDVWVGAATHDIATASSRGKTKWVHRIDPHIDRERDWVATDLLFSGTATAYADLDRPAAPKETQNATGDNILTDGKVTVVQLKAATNTASQTSTPAINPGP
ncbi:MAG TPA: LssY C-terminal domain-containing protein [Terriglobales bacterium]|nr:LssY C-terminal domain-containing protein [Terriglobales bacterium]